MAWVEWNPDYLDLVDCFRAEGVEFLVVGAFALAEHGLPRATGDLDVLVRPTLSNARCVCAALARFGAPLATAPVTPDELTRPGTVYQLGVVPRRIDIMTAISGLSFDEAWSSRVEELIHGHPLAFLGCGALLANKRASGRPKDLRDADDLEALQASRRR